MYLSVCFSKRAELGHWVITGSIHRRFGRTGAQKISEGDSTPILFFRDEEYSGASVPSFRFKANEFMLVKEIVRKLPMQFAASFSTLILSS